MSSTKAQAPLRQLLTPNSKLKPFQDIPGPKPLPVIGNIWRYLPLIGEYKTNALYDNGKYNLQKYGPIVREQITNQHTILHLFDPNDIESLFRQDSRYPMRRSHRALLKYRRDRPHLYVDGGLFPENNESWHRQRTQFQMYFTKSKIATMVDKISKATEYLIEEVSSQEEAVNIKFKEILYRWALSNSLLVFLDCDIRQLECVFVERCIEELHSSLLAIEQTEMFSQKWQKNPNRCPFYRKLINSQEFLYDFVSKRVKQSRGQCENIPENYMGENFFLSNSIDSKDVISFVIDSLLAGLHTTSYVAGHLLYHLSNNPNIQIALQEEIKVKLGHNHGKYITYDQVESMTLLRNCLKETLRLNPVSIGTGRVSHKDLNIRGYKVPQGIMIITQNQVISRDPQVFKEPDSFKPDRWLQGSKSSPKDQSLSPFATLPFGFGPRACIGKRLAELQVKILTAKLLSKFDLVDFKPIATKTTLVHVFDGNLEVKFRKRNDLT